MCNVLLKPVCNVLGIQERIAPAVWAEAKTHVEVEPESHLEKVWVFRIHSKEVRVGTVCRAPGTTPMFPGEGSPCEGPRSGLVKVQCIYPINLGPYTRQSRGRAVIPTKVKRGPGDPKLFTGSRHFPTP